MPNPKRRHSPDEKRETPGPRRAHPPDLLRLPQVRQPQAAAPGLPRVRALQGTAGDGRDRRLIRTASMRIAVDAMGGDFGPKATVPGRPARGRGLRRRHPSRRPRKRHQPRDRPDRAPGDPGSPSSTRPRRSAWARALLAFRKKKASSIRVGAQLVKDGRADAFVSMGNTGRGRLHLPRRPGFPQGRGPAGPGPPRPRRSRGRPCSSTSGPTPTASPTTSSSSPSWARSSWRRSSA